VPTFELVLGALNRDGVRYVVVGGVAVVLHGHPRLTADLDLIVDLVPDQSRRAIESLTSLGLRPVVPVDPAAFSDPETRRAWRSEKHMEVFSLWDPHDPLHQVDLFIESPIEFEALWARSEIVSVGSTEARIASIGDLIHLKRLSGRPQDVADIEALREIERAGQRDD